jgi:hypothetical protein
MTFWCNYDFTSIVQKTNTKKTMNKITIDY